MTVGFISRLFFDTPVLAADKAAGTKIGNLRGCHGAGEK